MTRKDYKAIAQALHEAFAYSQANIKSTGEEGCHERAAQVDLYEGIIAKFCLLFKMDNPRFSEGKFKEAVYSN